MDKTTGILWANLDYFPYNQGKKYLGRYSHDEATDLINNYNTDDIYDWHLPTFEVFKHMIYDKNVSFSQ